MTKTCPTYPICQATVLSTSQPADDERPPCPVCHNPYRLEGAERYWEARWRDEKAENDRLRAALAATPAVSGGDQFHPGKCLPDCMMPDGGECCPGYVALYDAYWHLVRAAPPASPLRGRDSVLLKWQEKLADLKDMKARGDLTRDWGECSLINAQSIVDDLTAASPPEQPAARKWTGPGYLEQTGYTAPDKESDDGR